MTLEAPIVPLRSAARGWRSEEETVSPIHFVAEATSGPKMVVPQAGPGGDEIDLRALARLFRRRIGLILLVTGIIVAVLVPPVLSMKRTYTAQIRLRIERPEASVLTSPTSATLAPIDLDTEIERLGSQSTSLQVIEDMGLARLEEFNPAPREPGPASRLADELRRLVTGDPVTEDGTGSQPDPVLSSFRAALSVGRTGSSDVLFIGFTSRDPELAVRVPTQVLDVYLQQRRAQAEAQVDRARDWLRGRIATQRDRVRSADEAAASFRIGNGLDPDGVDGEASSRIAVLSTRLSDLEERRGLLASALADIDSGDMASTTLDDLASPLLTELRRDLEAQQRDLTTLRQVYGENHEKVVTALAAIEDTRAEMTSEASHLAQALRERLANSDHEIARVRGLLADARDEALRRSDEKADYEAMLADLDRERTKLAAFEEQLRTLDGDAALPVVEAEILSPATPPRAADGRGRKFYLAVASIAALSLSLTLACLVELLDRSIRSQQQVGMIPGTMSAGLVPMLKTRRPNRLASVMKREPDAAFSDALRWLVLSLRRPSDGTLPPSILITSAQPAEGKTTMTLALAATLSMAGQKVLLVDADLRRGRLHEHMGLPNGPGLRDVWCGQAKVDDVIQTDPDTGIEMIGTGTFQAHGLPDPKRFAEILAYGRANDRIVVIDSAPVLAVAETTELASMSDCTLLVTRWGRTTTRTAQLAVERLTRHSGRAVAVVINMVVPRRHAQYSFPDSDLFSRSLQAYRAQRS